MIPDGFGSCITDCDAIDTMPDLIFTFNGKQFSLTANEYLLEVSMVQLPIWSAADQQYTKKI